MLSYSELYTLLSVDPVSGKFYPVPEKAYYLTLAGALLFDASFSHLINDDWKEIVVLRDSETGSQALDEAIRCLMVVEGAIPLLRAVELVAAHGLTLRRLVLEELQDKEKLVKRKQNFSFSGGKRAFFSPDLPVIVDIHRKIRETVMVEEVPEPGMLPLISLMVAGGLTRYIFKPDESAQFRDRIRLLAGLESLGREVIRTVRALAKANLEEEAATFIGLNRNEPRNVAGGIDAVLSSLSYLNKEAGLKRTRRLISRFNQQGGFECPGCAWPNPDRERSRFEFCENGAKTVASEATTRVISDDFFAKWPVSDLLLTPDYWLEQQGRLVHPMVLEPGATHYKPISWTEAFNLVAGELTSLDSPDEAVFYVSGKISNEAAFLYQLFARAFGTNNLPNSANLCHEPSGVALSMSLGFGKSSVRLEDFPKADAIFSFGHNPGSNHPRMLSALQEAARNGCRIVAVNPMKEASLLGFADPQKPGTYLGRKTKLAELYLQPSINGDAALVRGMVKAVIEAEEQTGGILDADFIRKYTSGFEQYRKLVSETPWELLVSLSGISKKQIREAAHIYCTSASVIACWCLGITHHANAVETIQEITSLLLLRGNIGRPGAGVCPVRGHSNIQGIRTMGVGEKMPGSFLAALSDHFKIPVPEKPGMSIIPAVRSMASGKVKVLLSLGGNLARALPDTPFTEKALRSCRMTVMISTKLNRSHLVTGEKALILPCLTRTEKDIRDGVKQVVTIEDLTGKISFSEGCLPPASTGLRSEISIVAGLAEATLGGKIKVDWLHYSRNYELIRSAISRVVPGFRGLQNHPSPKQGYYLDNPVRERIFNTPDGMAHFYAAPLSVLTASENELLLMTIRSHDQFNTSVFGLDDRYRGISNERRILFMNRRDMAKFELVPEQQVTITSYNDGQYRMLEGYYVVPYPIREGCAAAYFPETNVLTSVYNTCKLSETPAYKAIRIRVSKSDN